MQIAASGHPTSRFKDRDDIFFDPDATPRGDAAESAEGDVRVLPVHFDRDGTRHRRGRRLRRLAYPGALSHE